jgi:hypothetical protein
MGKVSIIGTSGRKEDAPFVNANTFDWIVDTCRQQTNPEDTLMSAGAAFSDHAAVVLALERKQPLILELPAPWDDERQEFLSQKEPGRINNYYHRQFSKACGWPADYSLETLHTALKQPFVTVVQSEGFFTKSPFIVGCDKMLAFSFNANPSGPSGGTGFTWRKYSGPKTCFQIPKQ